MIIAIEDKKNGLEWHVSTKDYNFKEALMYVDIVNDMFKIGSEKWKLPKMEELKVLLEPDNTNGFRVKELIDFQRSNYIWSLEPFSKESIHCLDFLYPSVIYHENKKRRNIVLLVRRMK